MTTVRMQPIHIIGGGFAGSEAAWQIASRGIPVVLHEMRPVRSTAAHKTDALAELVCSNSFRSDERETNAVGLLHEEMRRLGSLIMRCGDANQVPAGGALAVDREGFSAAVTAALEAHPLIEIRREEIAMPPEEWDWSSSRPAPSPRPALAEAVRGLTGEDALAFFDAIAPIVHREIDRHVGRLVPVALRQGRSRRLRRGLHQLPADARAIRGLRRCAARRRQDLVPRLGSDTPYFDGCLPIEVMAERGPRDAAARADEAVRPHQPAPAGREGLRGRAASAGQQARHAVQHGRLPDQAETRRAGARIPHHSRPRERRVRAARRGSSQHVSQFAETARRDAAAEGGAAPALCRPDHRLRGLRRESPRSACSPAASPPPNASARPCRSPPPTTAHGALLGHITGGHIETIDAARARSSR